MAFKRTGDVSDERVKRLHDCSDAKGGCDNCTREERAQCVANYDAFCGTVQNIGLNGRKKKEDDHGTRRTEKLQ